jgi:hypothetical protein
MHAVTKLSCEAVEKMVFNNTAQYMTTATQVFRDF